MNRAFIPLRTSCLPLFCLSLLMPVALLGSGTVTYEDAAAILPESVRSHLDQAFDLPETGDAMRLGEHFSRLGGTRVGPYQFSVNSRSTGVAMQLTVLTEVTFYDTNRQPTDDPGASETVGEKFISYEVTLLTGEIDGTALSKGETSTAISEARAAFDAIGELTLDAREVELKSDERWGTLTRRFDEAGNVRSASLSVGEGDHGASALDGFFDAKGSLRFLLWEDSVWSFLPDRPGKTIDEFTEYRFYFAQDGRLAQVLTKNYSGSTEDEIAKSRDAAENVEMDPTVAPSPWLELGQLATAPPQELLDLLDVLADYRLSYTPD